MLVIVTAIATTTPIIMYIVIMFPYLCILIRVGFGCLIPTAELLAWPICNQDGIWQIDH